jgi:PKD repeat protein
MKSNKLETTCFACVLACVLLAAAPVAAYDYDHCFGSKITWGREWIIMYPTAVSFDISRPALDRAFDSWNAAPGMNFLFFSQYDFATTTTSGDGKNALAFTADWRWGDAIAVALTRHNCANLTEADILFDWHESWTYDTYAYSPPPAARPFYLTMVALHELGHAKGLNHQLSAIATMNNRYPMAGTFGNDNLFQPHADDVYGSRVGYGTCCGTERDVAATPYTSTASDSTNLIPAPGTAYRGQTTSFRFTIENKGTVSENPVRVQFYMSQDRWIDTWDTLVGAATFSLGQGASTTYTAYVNVPASLQPGTYYFGWIVDPLSAIAEVDEQNNAVALAGATNVPSGTPPVACVNANPTYGTAPLGVTFDASCSWDPAGSIVSYDWDFGDGGGGSGQVVQYWYYGPGYYNATLTVTDDTGLTSQTWVNIYVSDPSCPGCVPM